MVHAHNPKCQGGGDGWILEVCWSGSLADLVTFRSPTDLKTNKCVWREAYGTWEMTIEAVPGPAHTHAFFHTHVHTNKSFKKWKMESCSWGLNGTGLCKKGLWEMEGRTWCEGFWELENGDLVWGILGAGGQRFDVEGRDLKWEILGAEGHRFWCEGFWELEGSSQDSAWISENFGKGREAVGIRWTGPVCFLCGMWKQRSWKPGWLPMCTSVQWLCGAHTMSSKMLKTK